MTVTCYACNENATTQPLIDLLDMLETLTAYLTLNDLQPTKPFLVGGQLIIDNPTKKVVNLAHKGYVLQ